MYMRLRDVFTQYRDPVLIPLSLISSTLALRPDSTLIPVILNLSILYTYAQFIARNDEPNRLLKVGALVLAISLGTTLGRIHASLEALSSKTQSIVVLTGLSSVLSSVAVGVLWTSIKLSTRFSSIWSQLLFLPMLWATTWWIIPCLSPVGYLSTWNVGDNTDVYNWVVEYVGPVGKNWIIGSWAVVLSQSVTAWYMAGEDDVDDETNQTNGNSSHQRRLLGTFLCLLTIPAFFVNPLPLPIYQIDEASPITVGCVIPPYQKYKVHRPSLEEYISETDKLRSMGAKIILWPEGAVVFNNPKEREHAFNEVRKKITGPYVGISFEETVSDPSDSSGRTSISRTGLAVITHHAKEPHLEYYKRNLVPFAESFRLRGSSMPPTLFDAQIPNPGHGITIPEWSQNETLKTRPLPVSASICLDFATASPFADLDSRPGLILAPARTWDRTVGYAMWLQARQRAEELNSIVLWCDGGEGGVSGIAGGKYNTINQVGSGSFVETIGVQYPFGTSQTTYARFGNFIVPLLWIPIFGLYSVKIIPSFLRNRFQLFGRTTSPPLIDV